MKMIVLCGAGLVAALAGSATGQTFLGPSAYLQAADSPLLGPAFSYFHLENFEDGLLNTAGASSNGGMVLAPGGSTDSVDADDGLLEGSGTAGRSLISQNFFTLSFFFDAMALGNLPTHAGIVWTDVGIVNGAPSGFGDVTFRAYDENGSLLGSRAAMGLGDGLVSGGTAEDRFFGVVYSGGITRIEIEVAGSTDWEVDHLQYGYVPAPAAGAALVGGVGLVLRRRR